MAEQLIGLEEVMRRIAFGRTWIYREIQAGRFPRGLKIGKARRWLASEVQKWIDQAGEVVDAG